ncbi:MAG: right-handed parallel beta-helix repeat-containing protein, partial [Candidatus Thermoplasmatota archaeon]|nr:right-handed parallel beta-helix repeat-containing protein [Candidatus Thermoplasmatota archaeon]
MSNLRVILTTVVLAFLLTTSFLMTLVMVPETVSAYAAHDPIYISGDTEFTSANGVAGGSGTASDPYIIEGWDIDATTAHGIWIEDTSVYFTIRNCFVHDGENDYIYGIYLLRCVNGTVTGNDCTSNWYGIYLSNSSDNTLTNNTCSENGDGIGIWDSSNDNTLTNNTCSSNNWDGINLGSSNNNTLSDNNCSNNDNGIRLGSSSNNTLSDNTVLSSRRYGVNILVSKGTIV